MQSVANVRLPVTLSGIATLKATYSVAAGNEFTAAGIGDGALEIADFRVSQNKDDASIKSSKVSPLSDLWAKTKADGRDQQVMALLPLSAAASTITVKVGEQNDALLSVAPINTTKPLNVDLAGRQVDVAQINVAGLQAAIERGRNDVLVLPFASTPVAPVAQVAPVVASAVTTNAWQISLAEISTDKAALA